MRKLRTALALFLVMSCIHSTIVPAENFFGEAVTFVETEAVNQEADVQEDLQEDTEKLDSQDEYFYEEQEVSGILLSVKADPGVFPKDAKLRVKVVNKVEEQKKVETAVEKIAEGNLKDSIILDISILDKEGVEIQPDTSKGEVMVNFSQIPFWAQDGEDNISIFHLDELGAEAEKIEDISLNEEEKSVEIRATHFSLFIISATHAGYRTNNFGLYAGEEGNIVAMFRNAFSRNPEIPILSVRSENPDIVEVGKNAKNEFIFKALKEGKARIHASKKIEDRIIVEEIVEVLVQKALTKGKIGENIEFEITGSGNNLTLSFKGYGAMDVNHSRLWETYKDKISTVIIGEGIETLGEDGLSFYDMKNIRHVQLPSTLQEIPKRAFAFCDELGDVNIPPSVKKIGEDAFWKNGDRKNTIYNHSKVFIGDEDYNKYTTTVVQDPNLQSTEGIAQIRDFKIYTIPEIEKCFFELETSADELDGEYYLYITEEPREITVEDFADKNYTNKIFNKNLSLNLREVDIRDSKDGNIKKRYFYTGGFAYNSLNGKIKPGHTYYCGILNRTYRKNIPWESRAVYQKKIQVGEANILPHEDGGFRWSAKKEGDTNVVRIQGDGRLKGIKQYGDLYAHTKMSFCLNDVHLELQGNITALDPYSLEGFRHFTGDLRLPDSIEEIGEEVFAEKSIAGNKRLIFPSRLKAIGKKAFKYCHFRGDITLPEGLKSIGEEAFVDRLDYENITIPSSVQYIGNSAFFRLDDAWHGTKNTITNYSPIRLTERYINPYFTDVIWKNSSNDPSSSTGGNVGANTSGSSGRTGATVGLGGNGGSSNSGGLGGSSNSGGSGGSSSSGASGGKVIISGGTPKVLGVDREAPSIVNWQRNAKGWWILYADGTYPKAQWLWLNHCWYYFNQDGYMLIGWQFINNSWYYFEENEGSEQGKMCIGWKQIKEDWYYFTEEDAANIGKMCTAWKEIRNKWYFFNPVEGKDNGKMLSNTMVDGYTLAVDGAWKTEVQRAG